MLPQLYANNLTRDDLPQNLFLAFIKLTSSHCTPVRTTNNVIAMRERDWILICSKVWSELLSNNIMEWNGRATRQELYFNFFVLVPWPLQSIYRDTRMKQLHIFFNLFSFCVVFCYCRFWGGEKREAENVTQWQKNENVRWF